MSKCLLAKLPAFLQKKKKKKRKILQIYYIFSDDHLLIFRFQLYYYADAEFKKEERKDTILTIDTRSKQGMRIESNYDEDGDLDDDRKEPPFQLAIKTK